MKVSRILEKKGREVVTVPADLCVATAVRRLVLAGIGALVVSEDGEHVDGLLSERDIVRALAEEGAGVMAPERRVGDIMTRQVRVCGVDDEIRRVMDVMTRYRVRHLPVVEGSRLVGIVSIGDIVKNRLEEIELEASVLRDVYLASH